MPNFYFLCRRAAIVGVAGSLLAAPALAQDSAGSPSPGPKNIIKLAPLAWIHGQLPFSTESRLNYERVIMPRSSVAAGVSYLGTNYPFGFIGSAALSAAVSSAFTLAGHPAIVWTDTRIRTQGWRWQAQYKYYPGKKHSAPEGFYVSPHFSYAAADYSITAKDFDASVRLRVVRRSYNVLAGYQAILGRHFTLDAFTGLGYRDNSTRAYTPAGASLGTLPRGTKLKLSSGLNVGWAF